MAGVPGFEPGLSVLETDVLTVDTIPLQQVSVVGYQVAVVSGTRHLKPGTLLRFLMRCVLAATAAELTELQTLSRCLLVLSRYVIAAFAISALQHNIVTRHS